MEEIILQIEMYYVLTPQEPLPTLFPITTLSAPLLSCSLTKQCDESSFSTAFHGTKHPVRASRVTVSQFFQLTTLPFTKDLRIKTFLNFFDVGFEAFHCSAVELRIQAGHLVHFLKNVLQAQKCEFYSFFFIICFLT